MAEDNYTPKFEAFVSPIGEAVFPFLSKPDERYNAGGVYKVDLSVPFEQAQEFIAKLEKARNDFIATLPVAKQRALTPRPVYVEEVTRPPRGASEAEKNAFVPEPTGNVLFRMKMNRRVEPKNGDAFEQEPVIVRADTGERVGDPVYNGSIIKVKGQIVPYTNAAAGVVGVTLRLKAVQVIELVTGGSGDGGYWTNFDE